MAKKPTVVSALGAIPKPNSSEVQIIHDCSQPHGQAVNDFISMCFFKFQTLDDAIKLPKANYFMAKIDLKHAHRSAPIHPANYKATGCKCRFSGDDLNICFYDTHFLFGAKSSPEIFHKLNQAVRHMMAKRGFVNIIVYLDDFLVIDRFYVTSQNLLVYNIGANLTHVFHLLVNANTVQSCNC